MTLIATRINLALLLLLMDNLAEFTIHMKVIEIVVDTTMGVTKTKVTGEFKHYFLTLSYVRKLNEFNPGHKSVMEFQMLSFNN